ncbi:MAG: uroporphyrinogen decarboxylase family protein, partial [Bacteroidota bacterium]
YISRICEAIDEVPITVFAKGAWWVLEDMKDLACNTIGLDWNMNPLKAKKVLPDKTLQGNLDPCALYGSEESIRSEVTALLRNFEGTPHIANLGHGVYPDTDPEKVKFFVKQIKELSSN